MAISQITNKKFLDGVGTGYLWEKIKDRYDSKLDNVVATDNSVVVANNNSIRVKISEAAGNMLELKTTGDTGLYVSGSASDSYAIVQDQSSNDYAAVYRFKHYANANDQVGTDVGIINIPKDLVVASGAVETKTEAGLAWGQPGTYIHLTLANSSDDLYINVGSLIEYVTSGSQSGDAVVITVDPTTHQVSAAISDGSITMQMLDATLQGAIQAGGGIQTISTGVTDGTISVDGTDVAVQGLGSAAFSNTTDFDAAGSAGTVLGSSGDTAATMTVYGVKQYASDVYDSIIALTTNEIDAAILAASL